MCVRLCDGFANFMFTPLIRRPPGGTGPPREYSATEFEASSPVFPTSQAHSPVGNGTQSSHRCIMISMEEALRKRRYPVQRSVPQKQVSEMFNREQELIRILVVMRTYGR